MGTERRAAVEEQCRGHVAQAGHQVAEDPWFRRCPRGDVHDVIDVTVDVEVRAVVEPAAHDPVGALVEPAAHCGRNGRGPRGARREGPFEDRDVVSEEPLRPHVPLRVGDADPLVGPDLDLFVLGAARRRQVRVADTALAAHRERQHALPVAAPRRPRHPAIAAPQRTGETPVLRGHLGQPSQQRMDRDRAATPREIQGSGNDLRSSHVGIRQLEVTEQPFTLGQQPCPALSDPPQRDPALDDGHCPSLTRTELTQRVQRDPILRRGALQRDATRQRTRGPVPGEKWPRHQNHRAVGVQAERAAFAGHQPGLTSTAARQCRRDERAVALQDPRRRRFPRHRDAVPAAPTAAPPSVRTSRAGS